MKLRVGDQVIVTGGKDKGKLSSIIRVIPKADRVVVKDVNLYTRHMKPMSGQAGQKVRKERPLPTANVAIVNDKGERDRVGYQVDKAGNKTRIFKKTGKVIEVSKPDEPKKVAKKSTKK